MKKLTTTRSLTLASGLAALAMAAPAHAQFGGITFDPTQSAHAISRSSTRRRDLPPGRADCEGSQTNLTLIQQLTKDIQDGPDDAEHLPADRHDLQHHGQQPEVFQFQTDLDYGRERFAARHRAELVRGNGWPSGSIERPVPEREPCLETHAARNLRNVFELLEPGDCRQQPAAHDPRAHRGDGCSIEQLPLSRERLSVQPDQQPRGEQRSEYAPSTTLPTSRTAKWNSSI